MLDKWISEMLFLFLLLCTTLGIPLSACACTLTFSHHILQLDLSSHFSPIPTFTPPPPHFLPSPCYWEFTCTIIGKAFMINSSPVIILQIYSQYVEVSDSLQQEKDENIRLKQYLDQILKVTWNVTVLRLHC